MIFKAILLKSKVLCWSNETEIEYAVEKTVAIWPVHASLSLKATLCAEGWLLLVQQQLEIPVQESCTSQFTWNTCNYLRSRLWNSHPSTPRIEHKLSRQNCPDWLGLKIQFPKQKPCLIQSNTCCNRTVWKLLSVLWWQWLEGYKFIYSGIPQELPGAQTQCSPLLCCLNLSQLSHNDIVLVCRFLLL